MAVTDKMIRAMAQLPAVCEHLHLPLQSGSDRILERMQRDYSRADYRRRVGALRAAVPQVALTTDIIVGFPGETEEDFEQTIDAAREFAFSALFAFKYSPRPNTPALTLDGHLDEASKVCRLQRLLAIQQELVAVRLAALVGTTQEALIEGHSRSHPGWLYGRLRTNELVHLPADEGLIGRSAPVTITRARAGRLEGELG